MHKYLKSCAGVCSGNYIYFWKSKELFDERFNSITTSNYSINPELIYNNTKARVKFSGSCLKQNKAIDNHAKIVKVYIVYEISENYNISSYLTLEYCLFGAVCLTEYVDIN